MNRRETVLTLLALSASVMESRDVRGQPRNGPRRIGLLLLAGENDPLGKLAIQELTKQLKELGYVEGHDVIIDRRFAERVVERLPTLAKELVALQPALLVAAPSYAVAAAIEATRSIPIVMLGTSNPVEAGFVASLGRPGGNVTGTTYNPPEIAGKMVEVVKAALPRTSRITIIWNPDAPGLQVFKPYAERAAESLGVVIHYVDVRRPEEFAIDTVLRGRPDAFYVVTDTVFAPHMESIVRVALERKIPSIGLPRRFVEAGGLLYYGLDLREFYRISATYVDRILKGAKPADLPIQQPTKYELVVNLRTAKAIGVTIPKSMLARADEIIQ